MLTRRTALSVLPAAVVLDANFGGPAEAQTLPLPTSKIQPIEKIYEAVTTSKSDILNIGISVKDFADKVNQYLESNKFALHANTTDQILQYMRDAFAYKPGTIPEKGFGTFFDAIDRGTSAVKDFLLPELRDETNKGSRFARALDVEKKRYEWTSESPPAPGKKDISTEGEAKNDMAKPTVFGRTYTAEELLGIVVDESREIARYLSDPVRKVAEFLTRKDDRTDEDQVQKKNTYKDWLYPRIDKVWAAGYYASRMSPLAFPIAAQAYTTYYFVLKLFNDRPNYGNLQSRNRARSLAAIADAYDLFDTGLQTYRKNSEFVRATVNRLVSDWYTADGKGGLYLGSEIRGEEVNEPVTPKKQNAAFSVPIRFSSEQAVFTRDVQVFYGNYYIESDSIMLVFENTKPYEDPFFFKTNILNILPRPRVNKSAGIDKLNDRDRPCLPSRIPRIDEDAEDWLGGPSIRMANVSSINQNDYKGILEGRFFAEFYDDLRGTIAQVRNRYAEVQVVFNCYERMTYTFLHMLGFGGTVDET